jgi:hypothetical protein
LEQAAAEQEAQRLAAKEAKLKAKQKDEELKRQQ